MISNMDNTYSDEAQAETQVVMFVDGPSKLPEEAVDVAVDVEPSDGFFQEAVIGALLHKAVACFLVRVLSQCCAPTIYCPHSSGLHCTFLTQPHFLHTTRRIGQAMALHFKSTQKSRKLAMILAHRRPRNDHDALHESRSPISSTSAPASSQQPAFTSQHIPNTVSVHI
jgi:hypothetical protein